MNKEIKKGEYGDVPFGIILKSDILTSGDIQVVEDLMPELKETFLKSQIFRTRTEMEVSVLNDIKFPTPASKYWQSVREQNVMFNELVMLSYEYRKNLIEIKILERDIAGQTASLERDLLQIELEKKTYLARNHERVAKDRIREIRAWSDIKAREAEKMTSVELSGVDHHQLVSYTKRWLRQAAVMTDTVSQGERQNLLGQLQSGLKACQREGLLLDVFKGFDHGSPFVRQLISQYQLKLK